MLLRPPKSPPRSGRRKLIAQVGQRLRAGSRTQRIEPDGLLRRVAGLRARQRLVGGFFGGAMSVPAGESDESSRTVPVELTTTPN
jgi:hypothetical protein